MQMHSDTRMQNIVRKENLIFNPKSFWKFVKNKQKSGQASSGLMSYDSQIAPNEIVKQPVTI